MLTIFLPMPFIACAAIVLLMRWDRKRRMADRVNRLIARLHD